MSKLSLLFAGVIVLFSCKQKVLPLETCFNIKGQSRFTIGKPLQLSALKIKYGIDEGGVNFGKNNHIKDYGSVDSTLRIIEGNGQIAGAIIFSVNEQSSDLLSLNCFWQFMIADNEQDRITALKKIKEKFLNCLDIDKLNTKSGGQYSSVKNGRTETFTLAPRFRNGIDGTYWALYYAVK